MNKLAKVLIGVGVAAIGAYAVKKLSDKNRYTHVTENADEENEVDEPSTFKEAAARKVDSILLFVVQNKEKVDAATTILGFVAAGIGVVSGAKELMRGDDISKSINDLNYKMDTMALIYEQSFVPTYNYNVNATLHNQVLIHDKLQELLEKEATCAKVQKKQ